VVKRTLAALALTYTATWYALWEVSHRAQDPTVRAHYSTPELRALHWFAVKGFILLDGFLVGLFAVILILTISRAWRTINAH
jgi:hypothetical protein